MQVIPAAVKLTSSRAAAIDATTPLGMPSQPSAVRFFHIDLIKAVAATLVVMVHCMRPGWDPAATRFEIWHGSVVAILVTPAFLYCAGFLSAQRRPVSVTTCGQRYRRLLLPYLVASVLAEVYRAAYLGEVVAPVQDLLLANAFGPYYFVFHMVLLTPLTLALSRLSERSRRALLILMLAAGSVRSIDFWVTDRGLDPHLGFLLLVRNPFIYWGFFLAGWESRLAQDTIFAWHWRHRNVLLWATGCVIAAASIEGWYTPGHQTPWLSYPLIYATLLALELAPATRTGTWSARLVRWLSEHTYDFYLFHLFFVITAMRLWPHAPGEFSLDRFAVHYAAGLVGVASISRIRDAVRPTNAAG